MKNFAWDLVIKPTSSVTRYSMCDFFDFVWQMFMCMTVLFVYAVELLSRPNAHTTAVELKIVRACQQIFTFLPFIYLWRFVYTFMI